MAYTTFCAHWVPRWRSLFFKTLWEYLFRKKNKVHSRPAKKLDPEQYSPDQLFPGLIQGAVYENSACCKCKKA